ncbi:MAG: hypothetical protein JSS02_24385 [Planctomycetes bacterium]|nr:hypothetical protein [Planctomycetota bacterium]
MTCLTSALVNLIGYAVEQFPDATGGVAYLDSREAATILDRTAELNQQLHQILQQDGKPTAGAIENDVTLVQIAWLLERWVAANALLDICVDPTVRKFYPQTKFWVEYSRALCFFRDKQRYEPVITKVQGYEQYWVPYLNLIADLTNLRETSKSRQEIATAFQKRNRDKRLLDWRMIDGDGKHPVLWDFREASILRFAEVNP